tara:strand:- start:33 stop:461 length:429 start_codon:yes stop_codon:yes gene_type:complete
MPLIDARTRVRIVVSFVLMLSSYSSNEHPCASRIFFFSTLFFVKYSRIKKNARCYGDSYDARVGVEGIGQSKIEINTVLGLFVLDFPFPKKKERKKERGDYILSPLQKVGQILSLDDKKKKKSKSSSSLLFRARRRRLPTRK